jgi:hypothetical protein
MRKDDGLTAQTQPSSAGNNLSHPLLMQYYGFGSSWPGTHITGSCILQSQLTYTFASYPTDHQGTPAFDLATCKWQCTKINPFNLSKIHLEWLVHSKVYLTLTVWMG